MASVAEVGSVCVVDARRSCTCPGASSVAVSLECEVFMVVSFVFSPYPRKEGSSENCLSPYNKSHFIGGQLVHAKYKRMIYDNSRNCSASWLRFRETIPE